MTYQPATIDAWVYIATRGLVPEAQERVATEIRDHATQMQHDGGMCEADVVRALGDVRKANRRYRRRHMTEKDADWLRNTFFPHSGTNGFGYMGIVLLLLGLIPLVFELPATGGEAIEWKNLLNAAFPILLGVLFIENATRRDRVRQTSLLRMTLFTGTLIFVLLTANVMFFILELGAVSLYFTLPIFAIFIFMTFHQYAFRYRRVRKYPAVRERILDEVLFAVGD